MTTGLAVRTRLSPKWEARLRTLSPRAVYIVPTVVYLVLVLLGVTNSNIGVDFLRQDPAHPDGLQIGRSQPIRSDEYTTESPIWLAETAGGDEQLYPLSVSNDFFAQLPGAGPVSAIVFFDGTVIRWAGFIPDQMLFAAKWWLPTLLLFLGLPVWIRQLTGRLRWGYVAAVLTFVAPASEWWSGRPINTIGFTAAGCALVIASARRLDDRRWLTGGLLMLLAGILLARMPTYYQPLAIVVGIPLVVATGAYLLTRRASLRQRIVSIAAVVVSGAFWTGLLFWENRAAVEVGLQTVFPGSRRTTGTATELGLVFGATNLGTLWRIASTAVPNASEIISSFTVLLVVLVILIAASRWRGTRVHAVAFWCTFGIAAFWLLWTTVNWGAIGYDVPLANRVPYFRAAQSVGFIATIAFALFMSQWKPPRRLRVPVAAGATAGVVSAIGGAALQNSQLPTLPTWVVWGSAVVIAAVVFVTVRWADRTVAIVVIIAYAVLLTLPSNRALFGLGDLRTSTTAQKFLVWGEAARADHTVWATDSQYLDALLTSTATPSLSYRQQIGPDFAAWRKLDPGAHHENLWNRGGLYIRFEWRTKPGISFSQPSPDVVIMTASPCTVAQRYPALKHIASSTRLDLPCLTSTGHVEWGGSEFTVYSVASG